MQIVYLGGLAFKIRQKKLDLIIAPIKVNFPPLKADIAILPPHQAEAERNKIQGDPFLIDAPGEYEVDGVSVFGLKDIFLIETDGIRCCYLANLKSDLTEKQQEELDGVDILFLPLGKEGLKIPQAVKAVGQIQPQVVLPVDHQASDEFCQELGQEKVRKEKKLVFSPSSLAEEMEIVILKKK